MKTLDDFDWSFNPGLPKALIVDLATAASSPNGAASFSSVHPGWARATSA